MKHGHFAALLASALLAAGCTTSNAPPAPSATTTSATAAPPSGVGTATLSGDGSTFVAPLMDKWRTDYAGKHPGTQISYTGGGSGKGRTDITKGLVDFAASDAPMSDAELANASDVLHVPLAAGGVAIGYHVAGLSGLKLSGPTIAAIFLGKVTRWNDAVIAAENPGLSLPDAEIAVVHRADGSGTTATFTDYLAKVSPEWKAGPGKGSTVSWPTGTAAQGNAGVGTQIQSLPNSIGYIGSEWSDISQIQTATVKNKAGNYVAPTAAAVSSAIDAALAANAFDAKLRGSATDADGAQSYPIAAVTWGLVRQHQADAGKGKVVQDFLWYALHEGQAANEPLSYAKLPATLVTRAETVLGTMDSNGQKLR